MILPNGYSYDENGFIKQIHHKKFNYSVEYKMRQGTNAEMSYLRLGWISQFFTYERMSRMHVVDVGSGNGEFVRCMKGKFCSISPYDVAGESISKEEFYSKNWDLIVLSDVLEHFDDIENLFSIKWNYCMLSFPETPEFDSFSKMKRWRHFKPNEHLYYLNLLGVRKWLEKHDGTRVLGTGNFEDLIRTRWDANYPNISSLLVERR